MNMMRFGCAALTMILLAINGCVELTGQRLSWRYDAEKDELTALLFYDGIHHNANGDVPIPFIGEDQTPPDEKREQAVKDLTEFVKNGDIMLADWLGHIFEPARLKKELADANAHLKPAERQLMQQALDSVHTHAIGHYRDAEGHIGAVQQITITQASKLVAAANAAINEAAINGEIIPDDAFQRTQKLMREAAKRNHAWLKLDGNSIVYAMPVDRGEWAAIMAKFWSDDNFRKYWVQLLTSAPVSYTEQGGIVTIRLGDPATPNTLRYRVDERYADNLVEPVKQNIPADLNAALAKYLLNDKPAKNADLDAIIAFGPPEQQVMALLPGAKREVAMAEQAIPSITNAALARLQSWAASWNAANSYPQAPTEIPMQPSPAADTPPESDTAAYFKQWDAWLKQMASYPVEAAPAPGASAEPTPHNSAGSLK